MTLPKAIVDHYPEHATAGLEYATHYNEIAISYYRHAEEHRKLSELATSFQADSEIPARVFISLAKQNAKKAQGLRQELTSLRILPDRGNTQKNNDMKKKKELEDEARGFEKMMEEYLELAERAIGEAKAWGEVAVENEKKVEEYTKMMEHHVGEEVKMRELFKVAWRGPRA